MENLGDSQRRAAEQLTWRIDILERPMRVIAIAAFAVLLLGEGRAAAQSWQPPSESQR